MKYITTKDLYLTFLTHNDSYMRKVCEGTLLDIEEGNIYLEGMESIDYPSALVKHGFIKEWGANPTGDGTALEMRRADDLSL